MLKSSISDPAAIIFNEQLFVFTQGDDKHIQTSTWANGYKTWLPLQLTGPGSAVPTAPTPAGNVSLLPTPPYLHAFYRDTNNNIQNLFCLKGVWGVIPIPGAAYANPPKAGSDPVAAFTDGIAGCYFTDTHGYIWHAEALLTGWTLTQLSGPGGKITTAPPATGRVSVTQNMNHVNVYYRGTDGLLWTLYRSEDGKSWLAGKPADNGRVDLNLVNGDAIAGDPCALGTINVKEPNTRACYGNTVTYRNAAGIVRLAIWDHYTSNWIFRNMNDCDFTCAPLAASDPVMINCLDNYLCFYYSDAEGNLVIIAYSSFDTRHSNSGWENFTDFFKHDLLEGLEDYSDSLYHITQGKFSDASDDWGGIGKHSTDQGIQDNCSYIKVLGPGGRYNDLLPIQGKPVAVAMNKTIHLFYRDTDNKIIDIVTTFNGTDSTNVVAYV